jgi:hypothetical protein
MGCIEIHDVPNDFDLTRQNIAKRLPLFLLRGAHDCYRLPSLGDGDALTARLYFVKQAQAPSGHVVTIAPCRHQLKVHPVTYICYASAMQRTTIFLPDELHEQLRRDAFRAKSSMAEIIRSRLQRTAAESPRRKASRDPILKVAGICRGAVLSGDIDEFLYGR